MGWGSIFIAAYTLNTQLAVSMELRCEPQVMEY